MERDVDENRYIFHIWMERKGLVEEKKRLNQGNSYQQFKKRKAICDIFRVALNTINIYKLKCQKDSGT